MHQIEQESKKNINVKIKRKKKDRCCKLETKETKKETKWEKGKFAEKRGNVNKKI